MSDMLYVITGASRGLGAALAARLLADPAHRLLCLARGRNDELGALARASGAALEQWQVDLADPLPVVVRVEAWLGAQAASGIGAATLINNAASLTRVGSLDAVEPVELSRALRVGLEAPLLLTAAFLRATRGWRGVDRRVLNVSSGLGRRAMAGQAAYCAVKAGLDHATRALALDEALQTEPARVVALAPGVIDTGMQSHLRAAGSTGFPEHARFVQLRQSGQLASPADAAARVLAYLARPDFGREAVADVRTA